MKHFSIVAAFALTGCSALIGGEERTYLCEGGRLVATSVSEDAARVRIGGEDFALRRVPSASGARYAGERAVLHTKADEALISLDGRELGPCQQVERQN
jgi:membrane-bound inhibitor of C-type lysozyme